jgi:hypothetical protein
MIVANTNYTDTLLKIEELKSLIIELEKNIYNQIPQGITKEFDESKKDFLNWIEEIEFTLIEFNDNLNR